MSDHGGAFVQFLIELFLESAKGHGRGGFIVRCLVTFAIAVVAIYFCVIFWRVTFS